MPCVALPSISVCLYVLSQYDPKKKRRLGEGKKKGWGCVSREKREDSSDRPKHYARGFIALYGGTYWILALVRLVYSFGTPFQPYWCLEIRGKMGETCRRGA